MPARKKNHDWLALTVEEPLEPDRPICDPHHHLWDGETSRVVPRYLLDEILEDTRSGHNIVSTVFIECGAMFKPDGPDALRAVGETEFVNGIAAMSASGLYGPDAHRGRDRGHRAAPPGRRRGPGARRADRGGRRPFPRHPPRRGLGPRRGGPQSPHRPPQGMLLRDDFRAGFRPARAPGAHPSRPGATTARSPTSPRSRAPSPTPRSSSTTSAARRASARTRAGPGEVHSEWRGFIADLATCPNVVAKLGGINMEVNGFAWQERPRPPSSQELVDATRPYYEYTIEKFGVDRCMFESNFPVDAVSCSYSVLWNSFKRLAAKYSAAEKAKLFHDTAARVYRLTS